jgi:hypothetical protein
MAIFLRGVGSQNAVTTDGIQTEERISGGASLKRSKRFTKNLFVGDRL